MRACLTSAQRPWPWKILRRRLGSQCGLKHFERQENASGERQGNRRQDQGAAKAISALKKQGKAIPAAKQQQMLALQTELCGSLSGLLGTSDDLAKAVERYKLEGLTGTYATVPKPTGDYLTGDHQPQAAAIKFLATRNYFKGPEGAKIQHRAAARMPTMPISSTFRASATRGPDLWRQRPATKNAFEVEVKAMEKTEADPVQRRKEAVELLKAELREDITAMRSVYKRPANDAVWSDLDPFLLRSEGGQGQGQGQASEGNSRPSHVR